MSSKWRRFEVLRPLQFNDALQEKVMSPPACLPKQSWKSQITLAPPVTRRRKSKATGATEA